MQRLARSPKQIGNILRRYRRDQKLTQVNLAKQAGLRQSTVSILENGSEGTKLSTLMDVLRVLDMEIVIQPRSKSSHHDIEDMF